MTEFYLQDSRSYVGDGLSFWAEGGGYTTNIEKAEVRTQKCAVGQHECRDTDIPWSKAYVDARARVGVDCQNVDLAEAIEQYPNATEFYLQKPKAWNGNNLIWVGNVVNLSSDLKLAIKVPAAEVAKVSARLGHHGAVAWPCAYIDAHSRRLVERDDVNIKEALRGTGIKLVKPKKPRAPRPFNCSGCGRFRPERECYFDCPHCGADNRP
jgi:hypothetical protein